MYVFDYLRSNLMIGIDNCRLIEIVFGLGIEGMASFADRSLGLGCVGLITREVFLHGMYSQGRYGQ